MYLVLDDDRQRWLTYQHPRRGIARRRAGDGGHVSPHHHHQAEHHETMQTFSTLYRQATRCVYPGLFMTQLAKPSTPAVVTPSLFRLLHCWLTLPPATSCLFNRCRAEANYYLRNNNLLGKFSLGFLGYRPMPQGRPSDDGVDL